MGNPFKGELTFEETAAVAEPLLERGVIPALRDKSCDGLKSPLLNLDANKTGRVALSDFYRLGGRFAENVDYLRHLGALEEKKGSQPQVVLPNYFLAASNCMLDNSLYRVCCPDIC